MQFLKQLPETGKEDTLYFVAKDEPTEKDIYDEWAWVNKGTDEEPIWGWEHLGSPKVVIDLTDYVKNTDYATADKGGVVKINTNYGIQISPTYNTLQTTPASEANIRNRTNVYNPITPLRLDYAVKVSLTDHTLEWTEEEKTNACNLLGTGKQTTLTQTEYDSLETKDENTYYYITEE